MLNIFLFSIEEMKTKFFIFFNCLKVLYTKKQRQTKSTTAVDPWHFKVKEYDISLTKNYCINISIQKISSIYKLILKVQQILGSHELKKPWPFLSTLTQK